MAKLSLCKSKKGVVFTVIFFILMLSFISLFSLLQLQQKAQSVDDLQELELAKMNTVVGDLSSSFRDVYGMDSLIYTGNDTEVTFSLSGNVLVSDHTTQLDSITSTYSSGPIVDKGGVVVTSESATNELLFHPFESVFFLDDSEFRYGGGVTSSLRLIEVNMTVDDEVIGESDSFITDVGGTTVRINILDNTSTTYSLDYVFSPWQANEIAEYSFGSDSHLNVTYGDGIYGNGTLLIIGNSSNDMTITSFKTRHVSEFNGSVGFYTNDTLSLSLLSLNYNGTVSLARG